MVKLYTVDDIKIENFDDPMYVKVKWYQSSSQTRYYRLECEPYQGSPTLLPTVYLNLGSQKTDPSYNHTAYLRVQSVTGVQGSSMSFQTLFSLFSHNSVFRYTVHLQSSASSDFSTVESSAETRLLTVSLSGDGFNPVWQMPTWVDERYSDTQGVRTLTGSDQKGLQRASYIRFNFTEATPKYGATIDKYTISIAGGFSNSYSPSHIHEVGVEYLNLRTYYKLVGEVKVTFTVEDTRGMETSFTTTLTIVPYHELYLTSNNTHRQGGTGSTLILDFEGKWYGDPLTLTCQGITAKEQGSSSVYATITPTLSVSSASYSYQAAWSGVSFDPKKSYTITARFTDTVRTVVITFPIPAGIPVLAIRNGKVGVENPSPDYTLDVDGIIGQNGYPIMGYVGEIGTAESADLNDYTETGIYIYKGNSADVYNFPNGGNAPFILRVIAAEDYILHIVHYVSSAMDWTRTYANGWTVWR